jgi:hypothetical protein
MLLNAHPRLVSAGELKLTGIADTDRYLCSCHAPIARCPFWEGIRHRMAEKGHPFDLRDAGTDLFPPDGAAARRILRPLVRGRGAELARDLALAALPGWSGWLARFGARNRDLVASVSESAGAEVVVDSSKVGIRLKYLLRSGGLDIRVVRVVRDGRGVSLTHVDPCRFADSTDPSMRGGGSGASREGEKKTLEGAVREWLRSNEEAENLLATLPAESWTEVRYEELCADPDGTCAGVFRFLGVEELPVASTFRDVEHHVVGNGMRLDRQVEIALDERWREVLTPGQLALFDRLGGAMNRSLGYR